MPAEVLEKERSIYRAQMENSGKPANVLDKIVEGKLGSFYKQVVLPDQESIRDPKMTVKDVLAAANKALGGPIAITRFARLKVGEALSRGRERASEDAERGVAPRRSSVIRVLAGYLPLRPRL